MQEKCFFLWSTTDDNDRRRRKKGHSPRRKEKLAPFLEQYEIEFFGPLFLLLLLLLLCPPDHQLTKKLEERNTRRGGRLGANESLKQEVQLSPILRRLSTCKKKRTEAVNCNSRSFLRAAWGVGGKCAFVVGGQKERLPPGDGIKIIPRD